MITSFLKAKTSKSRQVNQVTLEEFEGTVYVIGDVHGCLDHLISLEEKLFKDADTEAGQKLLVYIGDTVDRGPNSFGVIEHLLSPAPSGFERLCLKGNHEEMMQRFLQNQDQRWNGSTLADAKPCYHTVRNPGICFSTSQQSRENLRHCSSA